MLPLPTRVVEIQTAANYFDQQYGITPLREIRGHVLLEGRIVCLLPSWRTIARIDLELGLLGLGDPHEDEEEDLTWIVPTEPGELRLSAIVEI